MYTINGDRDMPESILEHLDGYRESRVVTWPDPVNWSTNCESR